MPRGYDRLVATEQLASEAYPIAYALESAVLEKLVGQIAFAFIDWPADDEALTYQGAYSHQAARLNQPASIAADIQSDGAPGFHFFETEFEKEDKLTTKIMWRGGYFTAHKAWRSISANLSKSTPARGPAALLPEVDLPLGAKDSVDPAEVPSSGEAVVAARETDPASVLSALQAENQEEVARRSAILRAEVTDFPPEAREAVCRYLRKYILDHLHRTDLDTLVAVGSAVRKYLAYVAVEDLEAVSYFLVPGVSIRVELEVSKSVVRKLLAFPPATRGGYPKLEGQMVELALTYINPRLLGREGYGATALNAVIATLLLGDEHSNEIAHRLQVSSTDWFTEQLRRRVTRVAAELKQRLSDDNAPEASGALATIERFVSSIS